MSERPQPGTRLDLTALTAAVDDAALTAFVADARTHDRPWRRITTGLPRPGVGDVLGQLLPAVIPACGIAFFLHQGGWPLVRDIARFTTDAPFPVNLVIVGFVALIALGVLFAVGRVIMLIRSMIIPRWWWRAAYRLVRFAAANGLRYGHDETVTHAGVIFQAGTDRTAERRLTTTAGRRVEIGNFRYTVTGENREDAQVFGWGYVAITLDRRLPHLLLDAKANNRSVFGIRTSNLPIDLAPDQRLALGGEFDDKFTLYAPSDYGRDAFMIFTPDLMALFIDRLGTFDVEIVDDTLFVYGGRFDLLDPATYQWLDELVTTVVARTVRRTERYRDDFALLESPPGGRAPTSPAAPTPESAVAGPAEGDRTVFAFAGDGSPRAADNTVAGRGQRLRSRRWGLWSVVGVLVIAFYVYNEVVGPMFGWPTLHG